MMSLQIQGWEILTDVLGLALSCGVVVVQRGSKGQSLSDPKNHYLRAWPSGLHVPCTAWCGEAGESWEGSRWKKTPVRPPISEVMSNHIQSQLGLCWNPGQEKKIKSYRAGAHCSWNCLVWG